MKGETRLNILAVLGLLALTIVNIVADYSAVQISLDSNKANIAPPVLNIAGIIAAQNELLKSRRK